MSKYAKKGSAGIDAAYWPTQLLRDRKYTLCTLYSVQKCVMAFYALQVYSVYEVQCAEVP